MNANSITLTLILAALALKPLPGQVPPSVPDGIKMVPKAETDTKVNLSLDHGVEFPGVEGLCFRITVTGWVPNGAVSIYAVGSKGEQVPIIPTEKGLKIPPPGEAIFDVQYEREGLHPGNWAILVAGASGAHMFRMQIPKVEPPTPARPTWKLNFNAATEYEDSLNASLKKPE